MRTILFIALTVSAAPVHAAEPPPIGEAFAAKVSAILKEPVDAKALVDGIPQPLVKLMERHHRGEPPAQQTKSNEQDRARWRPLAEKFDAAWKAYQARVEEVKGAVEQSDQALKAGKPDEARKLVEAVITPNKVSAQGQVDIVRELIDPRDAEIPALLALGRAAQAQKDFVTVANLAQMMYAHRRVGEQDEERLLWIGRENRKQLHQISSDNEAITLLTERGDAAARQLQSLGRGMVKTLFKLGLNEAFLYDAKSAKKGEWVVFQIDPTKVDAKSVSYAEHKIYQVPYNCVDTTKIAAIDPSDGRIIWERRCQFREETLNLDAKITFATAVPAWVKVGENLWFIGRVDKSGPKWVIAQATSPDWRFMGFAPDDYFKILNH